MEVVPLSFNIFKPKRVFRYRFIVCDDSKRPEQILEARRYLSDFHPTIEKINGTRQLVLNIENKGRLEKISDKGFEFDQTITQFIKDDSYIQGITGFIYFN